MQMQPYKKLAVQCSADTFVVNQCLVLRINICSKIDTFAKSENEVELENNEVTTIYLKAEAIWTATISNPLN